MTVTNSSGSDGTSPLDSDSCLDYLAEHKRVLAEHGETWLIAIHEAGHAVDCAARGVPLKSASILPEDGSVGRVSFVGLPDPANADCVPWSSWTTFAIRTRLSGDRAVRAYEPLVGTAGGGAGSDYEFANRVLEAICDTPAEVERELGRHVTWLDEFFQRPEIRRDVHRLAMALVDQRELNGAALYQLLSNGKCGAYSPDFAHRCDQSPHPDVRNPHSMDIHAKAPPWTVDWRTYNHEGSLNRPAREPMTPRLRLVLQAWDPHRYPPRKRPRPISDVSVLTARVLDQSLTRRQQEAALRQLGKLVREIDVSRLADLAPPAGTVFPSRRELHAIECGPGYGDEVDGRLWCRTCGFEDPPAPVGEWDYIVQQFDLDEDFHPESQPPGPVFRTAVDAARYVKARRVTREARHAFAVHRSRPMPLVDPSTSPKGD